MSKLKERLAELSAERDMNSILDEWNKNNSKATCTYDEFQLLAEFLVNMESPFKVASYTEDGKIVVQGL